MSDRENQLITKKIIFLGTKKENVSLKLGQKEYLTIANYFL